MNTTTIHVFTESGMGQFPFRIVDHYQTKDSCAYCGRAINECYVVESVDGKRSPVGVGCVNQTHDKGLITELKARQREIRAAKREAKWEAERPAREAHQVELEAKRQAEADSLIARYEAAKAELAKHPHPNAYFASKGKTLLDYAEYMGGATNYRVQRILDEVAA